MTFESRSKVLWTVFKGLAWTIRVQCSMLIEKYFNHQLIVLLVEYYKNIPNTSVLFENGVQFDVKLIIIILMIPVQPFWSVTSLLLHFWLFIMIEHSIVMIVHFAEFESLFFFFLFHWAQNTNRVCGVRSDLKKIKDTFLGTKKVDRMP